MSFGGSRRAVDEESPLSQKTPHPSADGCHLPPLGKAFLIQCRRQFMHEVQFAASANSWQRAIQARSSIHGVSQFMPKAIHARSAIHGVSQFMPQAIHARSAISHTHSRAEHHNSVKSGAALWRRSRRKWLFALQKQAKKRGTGAHFYAQNLLKWRVFP